MSTTTSNDDVSELTTDLSGKITKEDDHYFDYGRTADIWRGRWQKTAGDSKLVSNYFIYIVHCPYLDQTDCGEGDEGTSRNPVKASVWSNSH